MSVFYKTLSKMLRGLLFITLLLGSLVTPALAQAGPNQIRTTSLTTQVAGDTLIEWPGVGANGEVTAAAALQNLPKVRFQGYELPMQLLTMQIDSQTQTANLTTEQLSAEPWTAELAPAAPLAPLALDWAPTPNAPPVETVALPTAPIFVVRQGRINGQTVAVVAISPFYQENGVVKLASHLKVRAHHSIPLSSDALNVLASSTVSQVQAATAPNADFAPTNTSAAGNAVKIIVKQAGMQQVSAQTLATAGFDLATLDTTKLQLSYQGQPIPLQILQTGSGQSLRFYAPTVGDQWNVTSVYWLTLGATDGLRMATRSVAPNGAAGRGDGTEKGIWSDYTLYNSLLPGPNNTYWFHKDLHFNPTTPESVHATINNALPAAVGTATFSFTVSTLAKVQFTLTVQMGSDAQQVTWDSTLDNALAQNKLLSVSTTAQTQDVVITLTDLVGDIRSALSFDRLTWRRPAQLNFQGKGAAFSGVEGTWLYQWQNPTADLALYDVTNASAPQILTDASASGFQDGSIAHDYLLAGTGTLFEPTVQAHAGSSLKAADGADTVYIAPKAFMASLQPLVDLRTSQGYRVKVVDVQEIYDAWSYGHVSAEAIRTFLRFARANWQPKPIAAVLVGDGTRDPHDYEKKAYHTIFIPPYLANVDPWLGQTDCDPCFGQLDGDDPVTGDAIGASNPDFFVSDVMIGRLPIRSEGELAGVVSKLVRYETTNDLAPWRGISMLLADNYVQGLDGTGKPLYDAAGDFAKISDEVAKLYPTSMQLHRYYYDPYPQISDPTGTEAWRIEKATSAHASVIEALNGGAGIVTFNGHSNQWKWARLDSDPSIDGLLTLFDPDFLSNNNHFFITLSMTCLTSQFDKPADSGTVLDERLILNPTGGAVAVWGPSGLSVVHGHDALQRGFQRALWAAQPMSARLGDLVKAGYNELLTTSLCCQDVQKTFLLMGDPLMTVRATAVNNSYLPTVRR